MICSILLLISLTSWVSGSFVMKSYEAEENDNITLEFPFTTLIDRSLDSFVIFCEVFTDLKAPVLFHLHEGVELSESQDEQFKGRVRYDKDVLREGRLRLHVSTLRISDSGCYVCQVIINNATFSKCRLNVTAARVRPKPEPQTPLGRGWIGLFCALIATATLLAVCVGSILHSLLRQRDLCSGGGFESVSSSAHGSSDNSLSNNVENTSFSLTGR